MACCSFWSSRPKTVFSYIMSDNWLDILRLQRPPEDDAEGREGNREEESEDRPQHRAPEEKREDDAGIAETGLVALDLRRNHIAVKKLADRPDDEDEQKAHEGSACAEVGERQRKRQAHRRAEKRNQVEDSEHEPDEEAVGKPDGGEEDAVVAALDQANDSLPLEEAHQDVDEGVDLLAEQSPGSVLEDRHPRDDVAPAAFPRGQEENEEDQRHQDGDQAAQRAQRAAAGLERGTAVVRIELAEVFGSDAELVQEQSRPGERGAEPVEDLMGHRRAVADERRNLHDHHHAGIPQEEAQRNEDRQQHDRQRKRRILHRPPPPPVVRFEEQGEEKPERHRHDRRRSEGQDLEDEPYEERVECKHETQRKHRDSACNNLFLVVREVDHDLIRWKKLPYEDYIIKTEQNPRIAEN